MKSKVFHRSLKLAAILIVIGLAAGTCMFFYHWFRPRPARVSDRWIRDSVRYFSERKILAGDSAQFFQQEYEKATLKSNSFDSLDSMRRDIERAKYRAAWERQNGY